ncbi:hypothetical protein R2217_004075 [Cronobacter turicensis]|uniref:hypothetical protein n=1 Tax=Cronobacter dublinensis TaxID=413497 RepID=UPI0023DD5FF7|nr:hypothetical protein [Cronobacter dublinensis]ELQ6023008.1 hypothetical protein [Cronobacter turicensis]ELQ6077858.1 hypothetical protein [Cronobacter turicensis]ELQ6184851.1 hypothetical protein [Cronobacter turicensis]ELQ6235543.1 hypothetical protein [Cronobacter turicensis]ELQ6239795.1 hypothetical protein [Cronobacter turicensis]
MFNEQDYLDGWTTPIQHPVTGNWCYGGAARNVRTAMYGGNNGVVSMGFGLGVASLQPVISSYQEQLQQSQLLNQQMLSLFSQLQANKPS